MDHLGFVDVTLASLGTALGVAVAVLGAIAFLLSQWRTSSAKAADTALKNWREMAESEQAKNVELKRRNEEMEAELRECAGLRDDFAKHVVRAAAREKKYQESINDLQRAMGKEQTDWDDPTQHVTQNPDRR
jgi:Tfp pilus assembly protein PilN